MWVPVRLFIFAKEQSFFSDLRLRLTFEIKHDFPQRSDKTIGVVCNRMKRKRWQGDKGNKTDTSSSLTFPVTAFFLLLLLLFNFRCPTCSLGMRLTRSSATSSPSWSGNSPSDRPPTRTSTTTSCRACDTTSTWSCASRQWGRSSATERSSFRRWFPAAPWTGSAAGQRML